MSVKLFVTCGRGLDAFVKEELLEKIPRVSDVHSLGEGKICFTIQTSEPLQTLKESLLPQSADYCIAPKNEVYGTSLNEKKLPSIEAILPVYKLKLVERLFLMIYCEEIGDIKVDEAKMTTILENTNLDAVASLVVALKTYQEQHIEKQALCHKPDCCPGLTNRRTGKEEIKQKRTDILLSRNEGIYHKKYVNKLKRANSFDTNGDGTYGKQKRGNPKDKSNENDKYSQNESGIDECIKEHEKCSVKDTDLYSQAVCKKQQVLNCDDEAKSVVIPHEVSEHELENTYSQNVNKTVKNSSCTELKLPKSLFEDNHKIEEQSHFHDSSINFRVSCRITGKRKGILTSPLLTKNFVTSLENIESDWVTEWTNPNLDFYVNITDSHLILGVTLSPESLSLRRYISHITLRSTTSYLMAKLCCLSPGDILLDPMCGGGTILAEAAKCFNVGQVIGGDISGDQLEIARCNLIGLGVPFSLILGQATRIPLKNGSVNAVVCDFPFGQKHKLSADNRALLQGIIAECHRLLVTGGRVVFLLSSHQHEMLKQLPFSRFKTCSNDSGSDVQLKFESSHPLSLGRTLAYVVVLSKE